MAEPERPPEPDAPPGAEQAHPPGEALALLLIGLGLLLLVSRLGGLPPDLRDLAGALALLLPPYLAARRRGWDPFRVQGLSARPSGLAPAAAVTGLILTGYALAVLALLGRTGSPPPGSDWPGLLLGQLLLVALPEEVLFRGVLQPAWEGGRRLPLLGASCGRGLILANLAFTLAHPLTRGAFDPRLLLVFFPGLLFGWLRARTGSVLPGVVAHALANLLELALFGAAAPSG